MNYERIYTDLMKGHTFPNPMDAYVRPPKGRSLFTYAPADEPSSFAWWPIILAVLVAMALASGCRPPSAREIKAMATEVPTCSVTLFSATGDTLYHCDSATGVWRTEGGVRLTCGGREARLNGTVLVTEN